MATTAYFVLGGLWQSHALFAVTAFFSPTIPNKPTWYLITATYHVLGALLAGVLVSVL